MKKILFILFATQFILAPYIIKSYGANLIEDNYEYSGVNQGRKTVEKDIFGNIIIRELSALILHPVTRDIFYSISRLSLKPWGIALKFLFLHHENILFPND